VTPGRIRFVAIAPGLLLLVLGGVLGYGGYRWRARTASLAARLRSGGHTGTAARVRFSELDGLPAPVARYLRSVLRDGQPLVRFARLRQEGGILLQPAKSGWAPFEATQEIATRPPGFVWSARMRMAPGIGVRVCDALVEGRGSMLATVMGVIPLAHVEGTAEIGAGALHRYLAEAAWFPTALLPTQAVAWAALDESSSRATLTLGATTVSLDFHFGPDGLLQSVFTPERAREVGGRFVPTPWRGRWSAYAERGGMRIPTAGEVEWVLKEGAQVYWRGRVTEVAYELAETE
jgi:hypothetical protein